MASTPAVSVDPYAGLATVKTPSPDVPGAVIRKFADSKLQESIQKAIDAIPPGREGVVTLAATTSGVRLITSARIGKNWSVVMATGYDLGSRKLEAEAAVQFAWGGA